MNTTSPCTITNLEKASIIWAMRENVAWDFGRLMKNGWPTQSCVNTQLDWCLSQSCFWQVLQANKKYVLHCIRLDTLQFLYLQQWVNWDFLFTNISKLTKELAGKFWTHRCNASFSIIYVPVYYYWT